MNLFAAHWIDRYAGFWVCLFLQPFRWWRMASRRAETKGPYKKAVVVKFWGVGSIILASSALIEFKKANPDAEIHFVTLGINRSVMPLMPCVDKIHYLDTFSISSFMADAAQTLLLLRKEKFDIAVDLEFFTRFSAIFTLALNAGRSTGFYSAERWRGRFHTTETPFNHYWHVTRNFAACFLESFDVEQKEFRPSLNCAIGNGDIEKAAKLAGVGSGEKYFAVNINTGALSLYRRWPLAHFAELASLLLKKYPEKYLLFTGSKEEAGLVEKFIADFRLAGSRVKNVAGKFDVVQLLALLKGSEMLITNDSSPVHMASYLDIKQIAFFGPETPALYGPIGSKSRALHLSLGCSPCINVLSNKLNKCLHKRVECLERISPDKAFSEAVSLVEGGGPVDAHVSSRGV